MQDDFNSWQTDDNKQFEKSTPAPSYPMKWHNFLIYFSLWAGGILNAINGLTYLTGSVYGSDADYIYRYYDGLKGMDMFYGVAVIALGVLLIITRFQLAGYKAKGPSMLTICYIATLAISVLYGIIAAGITGLSLMELINPASIGTSIAMIFINKNYYDKRSDLFVY
ncbi:MAG: hypothetical protein E7318_11785 [Clostridiales bacterium]|nr:hypothetical protein [Clostridiales bacterium]